MDLEAARNITAAADAQLEASRRLLESLKNKANSGENASLHSPREGGVGSAASKLSPALGLRLGVPSRGGECSPQRSHGSAADDAEEVRQEKHTSTPPRAPTSVSARASGDSLRELPPAVIKESLDSPARARIHGEEASAFASPGAPSGEALGASDIASDDDERALQAELSASLLEEENHALREECRRLQRLLDASNRRRRAVEAENQSLKVAATVAEQKIAELVAERDSASGGFTRARSTGGLPVSVSSAVAAAAEGQLESKVAPDSEPSPQAPAVKAASRPLEYRGWITKVSRTTGEVYYVHRATGASQWDPPEMAPKTDDKPVLERGRGDKGSERELLDGMLLPSEARRVRLPKGPDGFGITIRSDAMVLSYAPPAGKQSSLVPVGWFLAAAAGVAVHTREDVLEVLGSRSSDVPADGLEFIILPPPLMLHRSAVQLTPQRHSVLWGAAASASFNKEKPKLFEHFLIIGAGDDAVSGVKQQRKSSLQAGDWLNRRRATESVQGVAAEPEVLCAFPPVMDTAVLEQIRSCFTFPDGFRVETVSRNLNQGSGNENATDEYVFLMHTQADVTSSVASGSDGAGEMRPMYGVCIRTVEIIAVTEGSQQIGVRSRPRCHTAPRCHCLLARTPIFDILFAVLRRFLQDEQGHRIRLQRDDADSSDLSDPVLQRVRPWEGSSPPMDAVEHLAELLSNPLPRMGEKFLVAASGNALGRLGLQPCARGADYLHIAEWALPIVLRHLSIPTLLEFLSAVALERHVMVACADIRVLSAVVFSIYPLLHPLHYEGTVVPVLAPEMYDLVHSPVAYCVGVPSIENVTEGGTAGEDELEHVHMLLVEQDVCRAPGSDQIPSIDCSGLPASSGQLTERLSPFIAVLKKCQAEQEAAALAEVEAGGTSRGHIDSTDGTCVRGATVENVRGVLACFNAHMSAMLDAISAEVASARHAHRLAKLKRAGSGSDSNSGATAEAGREGAPSNEQRYRALRFLRELAGTQMFAMHCFSAKGKVHETSNSAETRVAVDIGIVEDELQPKPTMSSSAADSFIEDFVVAAARWGMESVDDLEQTQMIDSGATEESDDPTMAAGTEPLGDEQDSVGVGSEAEQEHAARTSLTRSKSLQMMV